MDHPDALPASATRLGDQEVAERGRLQRGGAGVDDALRGKLQDGTAALFLLHRGGGLRKICLGTLGFLKFSKIEILKVFEMGPRKIYHVLGFLKFSKFEIFFDVGA